MPSASSAAGGLSPSLCGTADGAGVIQPPDDSGSCSPPSHGTRQEPLRPAWASWIVTAIFECLRMAASTGRKEPSVSSSQRPRSAGVMRPSGATAVPSMHSIAAPEKESPPRWIMCHSFIAPFLGGVLAHRRHHDPVGQREAAELQG